VTDGTDYSRMSPTAIRKAYDEKEKTASEDAIEADDGWSDNVDFFAEE
jgi:hypothetical protein